MPNNPKVIIDLDIINRALEYLSRQPYGDVFQLIKEIQEGAGVLEDNTPEEATDE